MFIDTHCHLHDKAFAGDFDEVCERAAKANVTTVTLIGEDSEDTEHALRIAHSSVSLCVVAGVHPHRASTWNAAARDNIERLVAENPKVVAIGETGLDFHYDYSTRDEQYRAFDEQTLIAENLGKPIVIHCRDAYPEVLGVFSSQWKNKPADRIRGVMHCWLGPVDLVPEFAKLGFLFGIGGAATFKNATELHEMIRVTPLEAMVLETDAPYMTPTPFRGKRNEPSYIPLIAARIAELKDRSIDEVGRVTSGNAKRLYGLK